MIGNSFCVKLDNFSEHAYNVYDSKTNLWLKRLGHFDLKTLRFMQSTGMVIDLPRIITQSQVCPSFAIGKCHIKPFPKSTVFRATKTMKLLHYVICGSMNNGSLGENQYIVLFIDGKTRMTWVNFLRQKFEVFQAFKRFKLMV